MRLLAGVLFLATLVLLPWGGLLRVAPLHENAQWSDVVFAAAALAWSALAWREGLRPRLRLVHFALAAYVGWAGLSLALASPRPTSGPAKLLGMAMLAALFVVTSETMRRPGMPARVGRAIAATSLLAAAAALVGVALSLGGTLTPLVGTCGDLLPGPLARAQAGFPHPNLLASYCVFAAGMTARPDAGLSPRWRLLLQAALAVTVLLTTSRAILAFGLALAVRHAGTAGGRRRAAALAAVLVLAMLALTVTNPVVSPARPWEARLSDEPSARLLAVASSLETLAERPLLGTGPGSSPGRSGGVAFDAHLTPLNVAATLGLPALAALGLAVAAVWRARRRPTELATWGMLAGLALDGLGQDVEDFRHVWVALGAADASREDA